jgi:predicted nucleic acid-binding protein
LFNYYFDVEREGHADTLHLFEKIKTGNYEAYTSTVTIGELLKAPELKKSKMLALIDEYRIATLPMLP